MSFTRTTAVVLALASSVMSGYCLLASVNRWNNLPEISRSPSSIRPETVPSEHASATGKSGGHGGATGHGAAPSGHGAAAAGVLENPLVVTIDELMVNLRSQRDPEKTFSIGLKLELELFEASDTRTVKASMGGIRNAIIEATSAQDYYHLKTTAGKLYFKEVLIERINVFLNASAIREVRFNNLLFQR